MNPCAPPAELARLIAEIGAGSACRFEPERSLYAVRFDELGRGYVPWRLARAQRELARLHVRELARWLRRAAVLGTRDPLDGASARVGADLGATESRCAERVETVEPLRARTKSRRRWQRELDGALALAAADGARFTASLCELLGRVRRGGRAEASELARASLALDDCAAGRIALAEAWAREGRTLESASQFLAVLRSAEGAGPNGRATAAHARARLARLELTLELARTRHGPCRVEPDPVEPDLAELNVHGPHPGESDHADASEDVTARESDAELASDAPVQAPSAQAPSVHAPSVQAPPVQAPPVQAPPVQIPSRSSSACA
jgi:hypothetical protein